MAGSGRRIRLYLGQVRIGLCLYQWTAWVGRASLAWNRLMNPGLVVGESPNIYGRFHVVAQGDSEIRIGRRVTIHSDWKRSGMSLFSRCKLTAYPGARRQAARRNCGWRRPAGRVVVEHLRATGGAPAREQGAYSWRAF